MLTLKNGLLKQTPCSKVLLQKVAQPGLPTGLLSSEFLIKIL